MAAKVLSLHFDESGGFEGAKRDETMVIPILCRWGSKPEAGLVERSWAPAWGKPTPPIADFHATDFDDRDRLDRAAGALAAAWEAVAPLVVVTCGWRSGGGSPPHYLEMFLEGATTAVEHCVARLPAGPVPPLVIRVECAYRRGFNTWRAERDLERRILARLAPRGRGSVSVLIWVTPVDRSRFLLLSDIIGNVTWRACSKGETPPFGHRVELDPEAPAWRLGRESLDALLGGTVREEVPEVAVPAGRPLIGDLFARLRDGARPSADDWMDANAPEPARLQPRERAGVVEDVLELGDLFVETRRAWEPAQGCLALASDLATHPDWTEGWTEREHDRVSLRVDGLRLVLANHEGRAILDPATLGEDRARAGRLLAGDDDNAQVLLHHNRQCIGLTNAFRFDEAQDHLAPVLGWLESRAAASPFPGPSVQLAQYLGTAGQLAALRAHAHQEHALLDEAQRRFEASMRQDPSDEHRQRQGTYLLHLLAERIRLRAPGWDSDRVGAAADTIPGSRGALDRVVEDPTSMRQLGDVFRVHALAKLACVADLPFPEARGLATAFSTHLPEAHPWPLLAAWVRRLAARDPGWSFALEDTALLKRLSDIRERPDLVGFTLRLVLLDGLPAVSDDVVARVSRTVPPELQIGWETTGYARRWAEQRGGKPSELLPFNFC